MHISVVNKSSRVTSDDLLKMVAAVELQLREHWAPVWDREVPTISADETPLPGACPIYLFESLDQSKLLGYHSKDPQGRYFGRVGVSIVLDHGGTVLNHPQGHTVSTTLSHEAIELATDPNVATWVDGLVTASGSQYALEPCDAVQDDFYIVNGVCVSDFVLPAWYETNDLVGPWNYLKTLKGPFSLSNGGYTLIRKPGGETSSMNAPVILGKQPTKWKMESKLATPSSRTIRRISRY